MTTTSQTFDEKDFLLFEYQSLRAEVANAMDKRFKIMSAGAILVPAAQFLSNKYEIGLASVGLPLLVLVVSILFISENNAIMRCGRYIR